MKKAINIYDIINDFETKYRVVINFEIKNDIYIFIMKSKTRPLIIVRGIPMSKLSLGGLSIVYKLFGDMYYELRKAENIRSGY